MLEARLIRRREFIVLAGAITATLSAHAQQALKASRIGVLDSRGLDDFAGGAVFRQGMRELGYTEGHDYVIERRASDGDYQRLSALADELVQLDVDVIIARGSPAIRAAQRATTTIPIIMALTGDAVASGLVASLARPGANTTGISTLSTARVAKHLEHMQAIVPSLSRVGVLANPGSSTSTANLKSLAEAAGKLGPAMLPVEVSTTEGVERGFTTMVQAGVQAEIVAPDGFLIRQGPLVADLAARHRLASIAEFRAYAEAGGLMSHGPNHDEAFRQVATYVDKILKGAKPADLPVEQPTHFEVVINMKTAKILGLTIPSAVLTVADEVIE